MNKKCCANCDMVSKQNIGATLFKIVKLICFDGTEVNPADVCALHGFKSEKTE